MSVKKLLNKIQQELKAPKNQFNSFGNYNYRSCEDILGAVKPLLGEGIIILDDEIVNFGDRYYIKSIATLMLGDETINATAYAREPAQKKGMDESQLTGSTSSYSRKYALNGLFGIDDAKDADTLDNRKEGQKQSPKPQTKPQQSNSPSCPKCGGDMWDNRDKKKSGQFKDTAPDYKCKDQKCPGAIWPEKIIECPDETKGNVPESYCTECESRQGCSVH